ncbi:hypothetical protein ISS39_00650 [Candidatus Bathyarchaeota archaeon]|nr:hypothetical protein [Candidatus Bathyarchaeota archaeon]
MVRPNYELSLNPQFTVIIFTTDYKKTELWMSLFNRYNTPENWKTFWDVAYWDWPDLDDYMSKTSLGVDPDANVKRANFFYILPQPWTSSGQGAT